MAGLLAPLFPACVSETAPPAEAADVTGVLQDISRPVSGGAVRRVRMTQRGDRYAFEPAEIRVAPGDVVRFVMVGNQPESVVFDTAGLAEPQAAYIAERGLDRGVLMTDPGSTLDVGFAEAPPGDYPFRSIPHSTAGMTGVVRVVGPTSQ
jgi:plastocyanin